MAKCSCTSRVIAYLCCIIEVYAYEQYHTKIPNGMKVPDPCNASPDIFWPGIGHDFPGGGGPLNPFGEDFKLAHQTWMVELCSADSDSDSKINGRELGDPNCIWTVGRLPDITVGLSHPGIFEPINSAKCCSQLSWLSYNSPCNASQITVTPTNTAQ